MKSAEGSYPHPVVGNADDVASTFAPALYMSNDRRTLTLDFEELGADNSTIAELVATRKASYIARVDCDATGFRQSFRLSGPRDTVRIPLAQLHKVLVVELCAIALAPVTGYAPEGMHSDYGGQRFDLQAGELLAVADHFRFELGAEWDPLKAPMQSLMQIERGEDEAGPMEVVFEMEKILIRLCGPDYDRYNLRKGDSVDLIHAAVVFPVLVAALGKLHEADHQGQLWNQRLRELLAIQGIPTDEPIMAAQHLLKLPVHRGLVCLDQICERGHDHDD